MKSFISIASANNRFSLHKNISSLIPLSAREFYSTRTYHINGEPNLHSYTKNRPKNTQSNYKVNKIKYPTNYDESITRPSKNFSHVSDKDKNNSIENNAINNDADSFGTLSREFGMMKTLDDMPDEEDDVMEKTFVNNQGQTRLSINQYAFIIKEFIKRRKIGNAIEVLETRMLKDDRVQPENYIYNLLIGACGQVGFTKKAFKLYNDMKKRGLKVTAHTYTSLFNACAHSPWPEDGLKRATHLRNLMSEKKYIPNQMNYHAMIKAFGRCGDLETAFTLVDEMVDNNILVSDATFNFLLQACIADKDAGFRHALLVWHKMVEKGVVPSLFTYNLLLRCSRDSGLGDLDLTKQVIQTILQSGLEDQSSRKMIGSGRNKQFDAIQQVGSASTPNLLGSQPHLGNVVDLQNIILPEHRLMLIGGCTGVLQQMRLHHVKPNIKTFTQLLDQIPSTFHAEEELIQELVNYKIPLDIDFCNMLIKKRCMRFDYNNAKAVLKLIQLVDLQPDIVTFGVLAMTCKTMKEADRLISDIDDTGFRVNMEILGTFLNNARYSRNIIYVKNIMQKVKDENLKPNASFMACLEKFYNQVNTSIKPKKKSSQSSIEEEEREISNHQKDNDVMEFCAYYRAWCKEVEPEVLPHPWKQFEKHETKEDEELFKIGKVKYAT